MRRVMRVEIHFMAQFGEGISKIENLAPKTRLHSYSILPACEDNRRGRAAHRQVRVHKVGRCLDIAHRPVQKVRGQT